jgi:hypothetical protein
MVGTGIPRPDSTQQNQLLKNPHQLSLESSQAGPDMHLYDQWSWTQKQDYQKL